MTPHVEKIDARWRLDSRGKPTVQARLTVGNIEVIALVPSGASTGSKEALELRDGNKNSFLGFGVEKAIRNIVDEIAPAISQFDIEDQEGIDRAMIDLDGTENKNRLGANAILAVSMAVARAAAEYKKVPLYKHLADLHGEELPTLLPTPMMNIMNGGAHTNWQGTDMQEFMVMPFGAPSFSESIRWGAEIYHALKSVLKEKGYGTLVGDEGGYAPALKANSEAIELIISAIEKAGFKAGRGEEVAIALDPAASEFYDEETKRYNLRKEGKEFTGEQMVEFWTKWVKDYPIVSIEDGLAQDDWSSWSLMTKRLGDKFQIVGDDLLVTNPKIFRKGIQNGIANSILIKLNQIGTLTETLEVIRMAQKAGYNVVVSHRSGETEDTFIADLAVATRAGQIKTGAPARGERTAKYNRLLNIEQYDLPKMGLTPEYAGATPFRR